MKRRTDASESKARTIDGQSSSNCILECGRHITGGIYGGGSDCRPRNLLRYAHPTVIGNQDEATWQVVEDNSVHM